MKFAIFTVQRFINRFFHVIKYMKCYTAVQLKTYMYFTYKQVKN